MNILLVNPRSHASYYSFMELFFGRGRMASCPPLGLLTVAGLLPRDWTLRLVDENLDDVSDADYAFADSVFVGAMLPQREQALDLVRDAKAKGKHVVCGGPLATSLPQDLLDAGCDILLRGEAEGETGELVAAVEALRTGLVLCPQRPADLLRSPLPRYDLLEMKRYLAMTVQTTRGCPHDCEFCDVVNLSGRVPRSKTTEQVLAELEQIRSLGWRREVFLTDDNFIGDRDKAKRRLQAMAAWSKSHGEPFSFTAQTSIELARDKELIDLMTEANFREVFVGVESPDEAVLKRSNKNHNVRNPLAQSLRFINENGLNLQCSFVIGLDGEKPGAGAKVLEFARQNSLPLVVLNILVGFPGTKLWKRLETEGRVRRTWLGPDSFLGLDSNVILERPQAEVAREFVEAMEALYDREEFQLRAFEFIMRMRPTREAQARARGEAPQQTGAQDATRPTWTELMLFAGLLWRHGVAGPGRLRFWRRLITVRRQNPSRSIRYVELLLRGDMIRCFIKRMSQRAAELGIVPKRS